MIIALLVLILLAILFPGLLRAAFVCVALVVLFAIGSAHRAAADDLPVPITGIDFLVDGRRFLGKIVTVSGCTIGMTTADGPVCIILGDDAGNHQSAPILGQVGIEGDTLDRNDFRRALKTCQGLDRAGTACRASVTGTVIDKMAGLGVKNYPILWLSLANINWPDSP